MSFNDLVANDGNQPEAGIEAALPYGSQLAYLRFSCGGIVALHLVDCNRNHRRVCEWNGWWFSPEYTDDAGAAGNPAPAVALAPIGAQHSGPASPSRPLFEKGCAGTSDGLLGMPERAFASCQRIDVAGSQLTIPIAFAAAAVKSNEVYPPLCPVSSSNASAAVDKRYSFHSAHNKPIRNIEKHMTNENKSHIHRNYRIYIHLAIAWLSILLVKEVFKLPPLDSIELSQYANIAVIVQAVAALGIAFQIRQSQREIKADHERSRREKSVDLLMEWSKNLKEEGSLARKIIECLSEQQCQELFKQEEVRISKKHEALLKRFFKELPSADDNAETITINETQATSLRWHAITYLNSLEFTLVAWQYSIVDRDIIEKQFQYLFNSANTNDEVLKHFRKAAGGAESFPAIEVFAAHVANKKKETLIKKANVA